MPAGTSPLTLVRNTNVLFIGRVHKNRVVVRMLRKSQHLTAVLTETERIEGT